MPESAVAMRSAWSFNRVRRRREQREGGQLRLRAPRVDVRREGGLQRRDRQLVHPQGPRQRIALERRDPLAPAHDEPGLRSPQQLVAAECNEVRARRSNFRARSARVRGRTPGVDERTRCRRPRRTGPRLARERRELARATGRSLNPRDAEVARMHPEDAAPPRASARGGSRRARVRFVVPTSTQRRAGLLQDLGQPERAADLDQLAARDHDLPPGASAETTRSSAAAPLLTTSAASAPVRRTSQASTPSARSLRLPVGHVVLERDVAAGRLEQAPGGRARTAARGPGSCGGRPRWR